MPFARATRALRALARERDLSRAHAARQARPAGDRVHPRLPRRHLLVRGARVRRELVAPARARRRALHAPLPRAPRARPAAPHAAVPDGRRRAHGRGVRAGDVGPAPPGRLAPRARRAEGRRDGHEPRRLHRVAPRDGGAGARFRGAVHPGRRSHRRGGRSRGAARRRRAARAGRRRQAGDGARAPPRPCAGGRARSHPRRRRRRRSDHPARTPRRSPPTSAPSSSPSPARTCSSSGAATPSDRSPGSWGAWASCLREGAEVAHREGAAEAAPRSANALARSAPLRLGRLRGALSAPSLQSFTRWTRGP